MALGLTACNRNEYQEYSWRVNAVGLYGWQFHRHVRADFLECVGWSTSPNLHVSMACYADSFICYEDSFNFICRWRSYLTGNNRLRPITGMALILYVDDVRTSQESHVQTSRGCYGDIFTLCLDDFRTFRKHTYGPPWNVKDNSSTLSCLDDFRNSQETYMDLHSMLGDSLTVLISIITVTCGDDFIGVICNNLLINLQRNSSYIIMKLYSFWKCMCFSGFLIKSKWYWLGLLELFSYSLTAIPLLSRNCSFSLASLPVYLGSWLIYSVFLGHGGGRHKFGCSILLNIQHTVTRP
jgi:hypothetical protein